MNKSALVQAALALALLGGTPAAHALFGDDEARKAIIELRGRVQQYQDESDQRLVGEVGVPLQRRPILADAGWAVERMGGHVPCSQRGRGRFGCGRTGPWRGANNGR